MNRIETFLSDYNLDLSDCHPDWIDMVEEYNGIKSALPENIREQKEKAIIAAFTTYHTVETVEAVKKPVVVNKKNKKKPADPKPQISHDLDSESLLSKADSIVDDLL
jgi:hypothetical protein